ncbi:hypothetical protein [Rosenbergiella nectarea]|uniref:hypothetical protein n=1 Tax=Rosenbergiella nectarea TaxID=988801 RepID=UPI001F4EF2CF|nr:hypothetical protein [Rosenbergiella nectarea]
MILLSGVKGETLSIAVNDISYAKSHGKKCVICTKNSTDKIIVIESLEEVMDKISRAKMLSSQLG